MEAVCRGKQWDVLLACRDDGTVEGALPYLHGRRLGLSYVLQPELTQYSGPWYNHPEGLSASARIDFENRVGSALAKQLDRLKINLFQQRFSPGITNWLPFHWKGYRQTTRYTYRFPSIADPDALMQQASGARRKNLSNLQRECTVDSQMSPADFAQMHADYWQRKGGGDVLRRDFIEHICTTALHRGQGLLWALRDASGSALCAAFVAYDSRCAYALLSAVAEGAPANAQTCLDWQMIRHLATLTEAFDFEGSMEQGGEYYYRSFGTVQTPYFEITRCRPKILHVLFP